MGEQFDLPRLKALNKYWESNPPLHILAARYMGIKPKAPDNPNNAGLAEALAAFS